MKMWKTINRNEIFQVLSGRANAYFISTALGNVLIDTGVRSSYQRLKKHIKKLHLVADKIDFLVLTHTHFDHCQNAKRIKDKDKSQIIIGAEEAEFVQQGKAPIPEGTFSFTRFVARLGRMLEAKQFGYAPFTADRLIDDKMTLIKEDIVVELISTPGHSKGSISVIVDNDIALVGDTMFGIFKDSIFPPFADDIPSVIQSWGKLLNTGCQLFLPGHGSEIKRGLLEKEYHKYAAKYDLQNAVLV